jgi:hypothetical protein
MIDGSFRENTGKTRLTETSRSETHACLFLSPESFVSIHKQYVLEESCDVVLYYSDVFLLKKKRNSHTDKQEER